MLFSKSASRLRHLQRCQRASGQAPLRCQSQFTLALGRPCHCARGRGTHKAGSDLGGCSAAGPEAVLGQEGSRREKSRVPGALQHCWGPHHLPCTLPLPPQEHTGIKAPRCDCTHVLHRPALCALVTANPECPDGDGVSISLVFM